VGDYFGLGQELLAHSGNGSNVHFTGVKGSDPFPECRRAPNLNYTRQVGNYFRLGQVPHPRRDARSTLAAQAICVVPECHTERK
jgi:hypothetical protein